MQQEGLILNGIVGSGNLWLDIMKIICGDTSNKTMIDLGCHKAPYTPLLGFKERTYIDIQNRPLDHKEEQQYFIQSGAISYLFENQKRYDVSICSDMIEHLSKEKGTVLLNAMVLRSGKQIIFTPLGDASITNDGHPDSHASGWTPDDFRISWLNIVFPNFHSSINLGAFFSVLCEKKENERIYTEIKNKYDKN